MSPRSESTNFIYGCDGSYWTSNYFGGNQVWNISVWLAATNESPAIDYLTTQVKVCANFRAEV